MILIDPRLREPTPELRTGAAAKRLAGRELHRAGCLTDDGDAIADGSRDHGSRSLQIPGPDTLRACADASMESSERSLAVSPDRHLCVSTS